MFKYLFLIIFLFVSSVFADKLVQIGVLAKRSSLITLSAWSATADYLTHEIDGYKFVIVPLGFEELKRSVENNEVDFVLTNTVYYVELEYLYGLSRIATLENIDNNGTGLTSFGGVIFTRDDSGINSFRDLKGKRFGAVNINSFGGWVMAQKELKDNGIEVDDFASFQFFGSHDAVVKAVKSGKIDAGTVRTDTLERMEKEGIVDLKGCKVLGPKSYKGFPFRVSTELYPEWPFAKLSSTSKTLANKVLIALLKMPPDSKAAIDSHVAGWTIPLDYTKVNELLEELHIGPYQEMGKLTIVEFYKKNRWLFHTVLSSFLIIIFVLAYIYKLNWKLKENKLYIENINAGLEQKVNERTAEIKNMYQYEKYLKNILKTIADINELLITSFSTKSVVENSLGRLVKHEQYRYVLIELTAESSLDMSMQVKDKRVQNRHYRFQNSDNNTVTHAIKEAMKLNKTIVQKLPEEYTFSLEDDVYECFSYSLATIPINSGNDDEEVLGSLSVFSTEENGFKDQEIKMLENLSTDIGLTLNSIYQRNKLSLMEVEKISNYEETILAFVNIIEQRDSYTAGHTIRVAKYCRMIAEAMGIDETDIQKLEKSAILHDIGKIVTPDSILLKPADLSSLEYELIKEHAYAGYMMLSKVKMYSDLADIMRYHHSRYDGTGYPRTPKENPNSINILSYIMSVADAFDAMTTNRIYKPRKSLEEALSEIERCSGTQFHPGIVQVAVKVLNHIDIVETSQFPKSQLEQRRFAYFFLDSLTDVYNENYFQMVLIKQIDEKRCLVRIELNKFSQFNKKYGWEEGNKFLKEFATQLKQKYTDALIFRYHGDNFILIFDAHHEISADDIRTLDVFEESFIGVRVNHYDLNNGIPHL
ncbi:PhnD/SsuA/transferrin family substrate-binding protein [bacterium]|nr:PhnD/SsuA/transferrin family substrate-binding protein [bacterium]MBU1884650.1 PhnD/SsuA/transferrin family substrate-binding protein [bacterium]